MDKLLYVSMSGASQNMAQQNIQANNLANVDTDAFKADFAQARSMPVFADHFPTRVYAMTENPGVDYSEGRQIQTGRELDIAIQGEGWLTVLDENGEEAFTRSGNLTVEEDGTVRTQRGHTIVGTGGLLILPEFEKIEIATDGVISIRALGQGPEGLAEVAQFKLVNPNTDELQKGKDGLFRRKDGEFEPPDINVTVQNGMLEGSNVNAVDALMQIISLQKQFEMQVKMMGKAEAMDESSARLLQFQ